MLKRLFIQNIALISSLELVFDKGLTAISGETGSGKSIIIDSLAFVLGERADKTMVKFGEEKAYVEVEFDLSNLEKTQSVLDELGFEKEDTLIMSRTLTLSGKNETRINGRGCTASMLKAVSSTLVDIFGQSNHLFLLRPETHLTVLDGFCQFGTLKDQLTNLYSQYRTFSKQLNAFGGSQSERERTLDILSFQIEELEKANLSEEEEQDLLQKHKIFVNLEKIVSGVQVAYDSLSNLEPSAISNLTSAHNALSSVSQYDSHLAELCARIESVKIEADDVASSLSDFLSNTGYNSYEIDRMETRLEKIKSIKRKYGGSVLSALDFLANAKKQYDALSNATEQIEFLTQEKQKVVAKMYDLSQKLSAIRKEKANHLSKEIESQLADLGMKNTCFEVDFADTPTLDEYATMVSSNGFDKVEFLFSANAGQPVKPLAKVISGGEMSRFMLAVKNITAKVENIPTMVFDEIDSGISGEMAKKVAVKLHNVSSDYQCLVITHLPQIVSMADTNLLIEKYVKDGKTISTVRQLQSVEEKAEEVARLMGGVGEHALPGAMELINWAKNI
ncbi:MAG: DNA repair protein RecN [Clostridia bacterium]|nr:DNA repair protein RecN [Clostridia bacterium]